MASFRYAVAQAPPFLYCHIVSYNTKTRRFHRISATTAWWYTRSLFDGFLPCYARKRLIAHRGRLHYWLPVSQVSKYRIRFIAFLASIQLYNLGYSYCSFTRYFFVDFICLKNYIYTILPCFSLIHKTFVSISASFGISLIKRIANRKMVLCSVFVILLLFSLPA